MAAASWFSGANLPSGSETYLHAEPVQLSRQVLNLAWEDLCRFHRQVARFWAKTQGVLLPEGNRFACASSFSLALGKQVSIAKFRVSIFSAEAEASTAEEIEDSDDASHWGTPFCMDALF